LRHSVHKVGGPRRRRRVARPRLPLRRMAVPQRRLATGANHFVRPV
jgi:hypothetical protein